MDPYYKTDGLKRQICELRNPELFHRITNDLIKSLECAEILYNRSINSHSLGCNQNGLLSCGWDLFGGTKKVNFTMSIFVFKKLPKLHLLARLFLNSPKYPKDIGFRILTSVNGLEIHKRISAQI
jgi:hypothetical protein